MEGLHAGQEPFLAFLRLVYLLYVCVCACVHVCVSVGERRGAALGDHGGSWLMFVSDNNSFDIV